MAVCGRWADIPFKRVRETTYPRRHHIPQRMMEQAMAARNARVSRKLGKSRAALTITHPNAAGIDIGSASHFVAVPPDRDDEPVREFRSFTVDLNAIADWHADHP
jgi:transposase